MTDAAYYEAKLKKVLGVHDMHSSALMSVEKLIDMNNNQANEIELLSARLKVLQDAAAYTDEARPWVRVITLDTLELFKALQGGGE